MKKEKAQKQLGYFFAGINIASIALGSIAVYIVGLKEGLTTFIASLIVLTILAQSYGHRALED